tara:strand:- start:265 stop:498 length:234 start_codon:yes stop_codon:yes gene_type:complete
MPKIKSKSILLAINIGAIIGWFALWEGLGEIIEFIFNKIFFKIYFYIDVFPRYQIFYLFIIIPISLTTYEIWFEDKR